MLRISVLMLLCCSLFSVCGCKSQCFFNKNPTTSMNIITGSLDMESFSGSTSIEYADTTQDIYLNVNISLESGAFSFDVISPDGSKYESTTVNVGRIYKAYKKLPAIHGKWSISAKAEKAKGDATLGFVIP